MFQRRDLAITNQPSHCRIKNEVRQNVEARLLVAFREANAKEAGTLEFYRYGQERRILGDSKTPRQWYDELDVPVMAVSNVGIVGDTALVCLELYALREQGLFVTLQHAGAEYWRIVRSEVAWEMDVAEEVPELTLPSVN